MINTNFQKMLETLFCSMYSIVLLFFVATQVLIENKLSIDLFIFTFIGLILMLLIPWKKYFESGGFYHFVWYFAYLSTSVWLILKFLFFNYSIYAMIIGLFGFYLGVYKVDNLKKHIVVSASALILITPSVLISPYSTEIKVLSIVMICVMIGVSIYSKKIKIFMKHQLTSMEMESVALMYASEAYAVHDIILDENNQPVDYRFVAVNQAFEKLTGLKRDDVIGNTVLEVLPETEMYWIETYGRVAIDMTTTHYQNYSKELNKYFNVSAFPIVKGRFAVLFLDITEEIATQEKLRESNNYVNKVNRSKTQFLRDINHRIRTPLNGLLGSLQLYEEFKEDDLLESIYLEAKHINNVVNHVSRYVEIQDYKHELDINDIHDLMDEITYDLPKEVDYKVVNNCSLSQMIFDKKMVKMVVSKLIVNAWKYSYGKPVIIIVDYLKGLDDNKFIVSVKDSGPGLSLNQEEFLFNEFYHHNIHELYKSKDHISLAMCKQILDAAGGKIKVENNETVGCLFTIEIPHKRL